MDQSQISFSMPVARNMATVRISLPLLRPQGIGIRMDFYGFRVKESTNVPDALNTITMTFGVKLIVECPSDSSFGVCYRKDRSGVDVVEAPPLGTILHFGGFPDVRTPESNSFPVHSISQCLADGKTCQPLILYDLNNWRHLNVTGAGAGRSTLEVSVISCLLADYATISFQIMNPSARAFSQWVVRARAEGFADIQVVDVPLGGVLQADGTHAINKVTVRETTREAARNNSIDVQVVFNMPPMRGTILQISGLKGAMTPSTSALPLHFVFEDGSSVQTVASWDISGMLETTLSVDARFRLRLDGTMTPGHNLTLRFSLINSPRPQAPQNVTVKAILCLLPTALGGCNLKKMEVTARQGISVAILEKTVGIWEGTVQPAGGWREVCKDSSHSSACKASEGILISDNACTGKYDECGQCDGTNNICLGCDLVPNSGKVVDLCGKCGGANSCVGCDNQTNSGVVLDACGVCGGNNECEIDKPLINITWPHITATLRLIGSPNEAMKSQKVLCSVT